MRIATAALVLVLLAGTQARHFWQQDEPQQTTLERFQDAVNVYLETAKVGFNEAVSQLDSSILQKFDLRLAEGVGTLTEGVARIREALAPQLEPLHAKINTDVEWVRQELAKVEPFLNSFQEKVQANAETLRRDLGPIVEELRKAGQANLELLHQKVEPVLARARDDFRVEVDSLRKNIAPYSDNFRQKLSEKFQELSEKRLPEWTQYQAQVQEKLAALIEKAKVDLTPIIESWKVQLLQLVPQKEQQQEQQQQEQQQS